MELMPWRIVLRNTLMISIRQALLSPASSANSVNKRDMSPGAMSSPDANGEEILVFIPASYHACKGGVKRKRALNYVQKSHFPLESDAHWGRISELC